MPYLRDTVSTEFAALPVRTEISFAWPTDNRFLFEDPVRYFASTRANPDYGRPGWTRDCGKRFHRGCDIAPARREPDGHTYTLMFSDCATDREYPSEEPGWIPLDSVYAVCKGVVVEVRQDETVSTLGRHVIIEHRWHDWGAAFYSLYAHLDEVEVSERQIVAGGERIGSMGRTSASADARAWMAVAPHLHLEFWNDAGESLNPEDMLIAFIER